VTADPVVALVAERFRIEGETEAKVAKVDDDAAVGAIVDPACDRIRELDDQISATVATSPAGVIGQVRALVEICIGEYSDLHDNTMRRPPGRHDRRRD